MRHSLIIVLAALVLGACDHHVPTPETAEHGASAAKRAAQDTQPAMRPDQQ